MTKYKIIPDRISFECLNDYQDILSVEVDMSDKSNIVVTNDIDSLIKQCKSIQLPIKLVNPVSTSIDVTQFSETKPEREEDEDNCYVMSFFVYVHGNVSSNLDVFLKYLKEHGNDKNLEVWLDEDKKASWQEISDICSASVLFEVKIISDTRDNAIFSDISTLDIKDLVYDCLEE